MTLKEFRDRIMFIEDKYFSYEVKSWHDGYIHGCNCLFSVKDVRIDLGKEEVIIDVRE